MFHLFISEKKNFEKKEGIFDENFVLIWKFLANI